MGQGPRDRPRSVEGESSPSSWSGCCSTHAGGSRSLRQLSTIPTLVDEEVPSSAADLRLFAVNDGRDVWVLPGGLTPRGAARGPARGELVLGGGSKDTSGWWVRTCSSVSRHSIQGLVAGQATVTEAITIPSPELVQHTLDDRPIETSQQQQQQQQAADFSSQRTPLLHLAEESGSQDAEPHRRVAVLDRALHRAPRRHRAILDVHLQLLLEDPGSRRTSAPARSSARWEPRCLKTDA